MATHSSHSIWEKRKSQFATWFISLGFACCGMTGTVTVSAATPYGTPTGYYTPTPYPTSTPTPTPAANPPTDFNRDGKPDYLLFNSSTRQTAIWYLNNNAFVSGAYGPTLPAGWMVAGVADFNRDGKPDFALFNPSTRQTAIWYLNNNVFVSAAFGPTLLPSWQLVATGDLN